MAVLTVNGVKREIDIDPATPLLWVIREQLELPGTKFGCGIAQCGACTIRLNGTAIRSCVTPVAAADGQDIQTVEDPTTVTQPQNSTSVTITSNLVLGARMVFRIYATNVGGTDTGDGPSTQKYVTMKEAPGSRRAPRARPHRR